MPNIEVARAGSDEELMKYYWVHHRECSHGRKWPCKQPKGYASCGTYEDGWNIGCSTDGEQFDICGCDCPIDKEDLDQIIEVKEQHP